MKKILTAFVSLSLCGAMLTGCGGAAASYDSLGAMASSGELSSLSMSTVSAKDSKTYDFAKTLEGAKELHMDIEAEDGSMAVAMAVSDAGIYIKAKSNEPVEEGTPSDMTIIIKGDTMYMLDNEAKTGMSMTAEGMSDEYSVESMMEEFADLDIDDELDGDESIKTCVVKIGGKKYTFESGEDGSGLLFDGDKLYAIIPAEGEADVSALIINEFSSTAPANLFEVPSDYEISDLNDLMQ